MIESLTHQLKRTTELLSKNNLLYALAGGVVASIYRTHKRMTLDLDFIILGDTDLIEKGKKILIELDLKPISITKPELEGGPLHLMKRKKGPVWILFGEVKNSLNVRVDFILPLMPWTENALKRAQFNKIDFGFSKIPCLTVEDIIISKLYSLKNKADRFQDLEDLREIFSSKENQVDLTYISERMIELKLPIPQLIKNTVPRELLQTSKLLKRL